MILIDDMKKTVEEAAAEARMASAETLTTYGTHTSLDDFEYLSHDEIAEAAFVKGAEWQSMQPKWISVKERLPEYSKQVFVLHSDGSVGVSLYHRDNNWTNFDGNIIAWMSVPSFDEILEANKDVLQRLKYIRDGRTRKTQY